MTTYTIAALFELWIDSPVEYVIVKNSKLHEKTYEISLIFFIQTEFNSSFINSVIKFKI